MSRAIERIGDNAVDIGEQTVFVVTGLFARSPRGTITDVCVASVPPALFARILV